MNQKQPLKTPGETSSVLGGGVKVGFLLVLSAIVLYLCWLMALPFLSPLIWAVAIALVARPLHMRLKRTIKNKHIAAAASGAIITITIIAPGFVLVDQAIREAIDGARALQSFVESAGWKPTLDDHPRLAQALAQP